MIDLLQAAVPGIPDRLFIRGSVPMTKEEIRVITLSKARLGPEMVIWDVGSGTGSISVEAARMSPGGMVYAVEKSPEGCRLTADNCARFGAGNVEVVEGTAPEALLGLPRPDRIIVGGSGGKLKPILQAAQDSIIAGGRLVINAVTLETLSAALNFLKAGWETEVVQVTVSKAQNMGGSRLLKSYNPVFIISAWGWGETNGG